MLRLAEMPFIKKLVQNSQIFPTIWLQYQLLVTFSQHFLNNALKVLRFHYHCLDNLYYYYNMSSAENILFDILNIFRAAGSSDSSKHHTIKITNALSSSEEKGWLCHTLCDSNDRHYDPMIFVIKLNPKTSNRTWFSFNYGEM